MELIVYRENKPQVRKALKEGRIEYLDLSKWEFIDKFFGFLLASKFYDWCSSTYPTPRRKQEVPVWFLLSSVIQMKLYTTASFLRLRGILRAGSILTRVKFNIGAKRGGFNYKNRKERETPVDQDAVRKYFRSSDAQKVEGWFNRDVVKWVRRHRGFDKRGLYIMDSTHLLLPDNGNYERAVRIPLDDNGQLINTSKLSEEERKKVKYKYCYGLTTLLHVSQTGKDMTYTYAGAHLGSGDESGLKAGEKIVDDFVGTVGDGVIKWLIMDRGFLDGRMISRFKKDYKINTLIPLKKNMQVLTDAIGLSKLKEHPWEVYSEKRDAKGRIIEKEEITYVENVTSWDECEVPLYIALMRRTGKDIEEQIWGLASTKSFSSPAEAFDLYAIRPKIEERHRQLKKCWQLSKFTSTNFSLSTSHVLFTLLTYTLIQLYLSRKNLQDLANKTIDSLRSEERMGKDAVVVYTKKHFATFHVDEYTYIILGLEGQPKDRLTKWIKVFRKTRYRPP